MKAPLHLFVHCFRFIVGALTNVARGLVIVGFLGTLVACGLRDVHVEPAGAISFQETLQIESEMEARLAAHFIPARVRGDAPNQGGTGYLEPMRLARHEPICISSRHCELTYGDKSRALTIW